MVVSGDMSLTDGAEKFIEFIGQHFRTKIDSLKDELEKCRDMLTLDTALTYLSAGILEPSYYLGLIDGETGIVNYKDTLSDGNGFKEAFARCSNPGTHDYSGKGTNLIYLALGDRLGFNSVKWYKIPTGVDSIYPDYSEVHNLSKLESILCDKNENGSVVFATAPTFTPQYDTVAVWLTYADTTKPISYNMTQAGYEVVKLVDLNPPVWISDCVMKTTDWVHVCYLNYFKQPLPFLVWGVKERREK
jgi:hypothetical protein